MAPEATVLKDGPMSGMMAWVQPSSTVPTDDETIKLPGGETERSDMTAPSNRASEFANENYSKTGPTAPYLVQKNPGPLERPYWAKSRQVLEDLWKIAQRRSPIVGPLGEYAFKPDILQTLWAIYNKQALPNEPTGLQDAPMRAIQEQPATEPSSPEQANPNQPAAQSEEPCLQGPTLLPHSLSPQAIKELRDEHKNFLQKLGVLPPTIPGEREAVLRAPTQAEDISMTAQEKGESTIGAAPVQQSVLESYDSFRKRILPELAPWQIEPTEIYDYFSTPTAPAKSKDDWYARVLPSSLVKTTGAISGITAAQAIGTRMGETGLEHAEGNLSSSEAAMEDLKAVGETVPGMVKGAVKGVPGLNKDWQQEWATDPVGTAVGLLGLMGIGKGVKEGPAYLSGKANVTEFLTKEGIPAEQVADTFKAIEKARAAGGTLNIGGTGPGEPDATAPSTLEPGNGQEVEEAEPGPIESTPRLYKLLAKNLEAAGEPRPFGHAAHHIVAVGAENAERARTILQNFDIPLHSADNGVWLPNMDGVREGAYHPRLHTDEYYDEVERRLKTATDREEVLGVLRKIKKELSENRFPY